MKIHIIIISAVEGYDPPFQPISQKNTLWCTEKLVLWFMICSVFCSVLLY